MALTFSFKTTTLSFLFILFYFVNGLSQNPDIQTSDSLKVDIPKAIPLVNIIDEIDIASEKIKDISRKIQPKASVVQIDSLFPIYKKFIATKRQQAEKFITANPNKQKANNLLNEWKRYYEYLKAWQASINSNFERNTILLEDVNFQEKTWELTLQNSKEEDVPNAILNNINSIFKDFKNIKSSITNLNNKELILESKINYQMTITTEVIEKIEKLKVSKAYDLFYKRHNELWNTSFKNSDSNSFIIDKEATYNNITFEFFKTFVKTFYLFIFLVLILISIFRFLKKGFTIYEISGFSSKYISSKNLIQKQTLITLIFCGLFLAKTLFTNVPDLINDILTLSLLIVTIPIVNTYLSFKFKNLVFIIILFFVLDGAKTYIWFASYQYRFYLLFEALLVIASLYYFTHPIKKIKIQASTKLASFLINLTPFVYFLAFVSIISNILGYTNLTDITLKTCTQGTVISIIFYGILKVVEGVSFAILFRHFSSKEAYDINIKQNIENKISKYTRITIFIFWLLMFLKILDQLNPILNFLDDVLSEPYSIGSLTFTLGAIITFLLVLISSFLLTSFIAFILEDNSEGTSKLLKLPKGISAAISVVLRYIVLAFGGVFAISSLGIDLSKFNLMAGALGLGIGFGLQNVISNFVSGLILIFERPILPGDTVEFNNLMGTVKKIGVRSSKVSTFDGADVVVPNNNLVSNDLINWTLSNNIKRIEILIGTTYDSDPNKVLEVLLECANNYEEVLKDPAPKALFSDFGDSSLNFRLRFWVHFTLGLQAKSDISVAIYNKFKEHNINIPFPQQDIYIKNFPENKKDED